MQTLDFITPVVDDPYLYGQIAAANSLSDVFAMGAQVINSLNIVGFDSCNLDDEILSQIMQGGLSKVRECGGVIVGGHSIATPEMYYGLSVTGQVHPKKFWANYTSKVGDVLIITKPLGMGALSTAIKADMLNLDQIKEAARYMSQLNFYAVGAMEGIRVNAATDVTGFGFLGHLSEMGRDDISFEIFTGDVPVLASAREVASIGLLPAGSYKNREFCAKFLNIDANDADILLFDAQTSGGLLLAVDANDTQKALKRLKDAGYEMTSVVGTVNERKLGQNLINLKP